MAEAPRRPADFGTILLTLLSVAAAASLFVACTGSGEGGSNASEDLRTLPLTRLEDKIRGGWAGQMIGVSYGAPTEFRYQGEIIPEDALPVWQPEMVSGAIDQDDLYVDVTFAKVLDERGLDATTEDFGAMFRDAEYHLWHANLAARRALRRGVPATLSGTPEHNAHANDIDFQIEADFVGLMSPGLPQAANELCYRAGRVMNHGDGILGGMFVSAMYAAAFFEDDPRRLVESGLAVLPPSSGYARVIASTLAWSEEHPDDWTAVWQKIDDAYSRGEACPSGAQAPFNIDAKLNGAYIALGLLYGGGDFERTLVISTRAGQDSDCNPASAAGILGVVLGYEGIPERFTSGIPEIADQPFSYTDYSFERISESTTRRAIATVERAGGRLEGDVLLVPEQAPRPAELELWDDYGEAVERISVFDRRWSFGKGFERRTIALWRRDWETMWADSEGAEATISFTGTGAIVTGFYLPSGGIADVFLDGELQRTVDVYSDEDVGKAGEAVWHAFGLENREHRLRLVARGEPYPGSSGAEIALTDLVVFRPTEEVGSGGAD